MLPPKIVRALVVIGMLAGAFVISPVIAQGLSAAPVRAAQSPLATPTRTAQSPIATPTRVPPTATPVRPTATRVPPTSTPVLPTPTFLPTATPIRPTSTTMLPTSTPIAPPPIIPPSGNILGYHVVRSGETLYCIARAYVVLPSAIASTNGIAYPYPTRVGQQLAIPKVPWMNMPSGPTCARQFGGAGVTPTPPAPACRAMYIVRSGDTLYSIAVRFKTSVYTLMLDNHITNPSLLFPGQVLCIR